MKPIKFILFTVIVISPLISQSPISVELDKLSFNIDQPGFSFTQDRFISPEEKGTYLNYFLHMAFWAGAKWDSNISVVSGDGNPTVKEFTEWKTETPTYKIKDSSSDKSVVSIYRTVYNDKSSMPGHTPVGLTVEQRSYVYKDFPALIYEYTVTSARDLDAFVLGMYFDFDLPELDQTSDPYNDCVLVDPLKKGIYMANKGDWNEGSVPAVIPLSTRELRYKVLGHLDKPLTDKEKWAILSNPADNRYRKKFDTGDDYRFIVFSETKKIKAGSKVTFSLALVHTKGYEKSNEVIQLLRHWYGDRPLLFKQTQSPQDQPLDHIPNEFDLSQGFPNPFNPSVTFTLSLPKRRTASVFIYDLRGWLIKTIYQGSIEAGIKSFTWNGDNENGAQVSSGVYLIRAEVNGFKQTQKIVLVR